MDFHKGENGNTKQTKKNVSLKASNVMKTNLKVPFIAIKDRNLSFLDIHLGDLDEIFIIN